MKNLRKVMATLAALSVMCMSASAFADTTVTGAFDKAAVTGDYTNVVANKQVAVNVDTTGATTGTQMTFIILDRDTVEQSVQADDILYIDQKELKSDDHGFTGVINTARIAEKEGETLDGSTIPDGSYLIKLGYTDNSGDFQIAEATMVVATSGGATTVQILWGDVNQDDSVNVNDSAKILSWLIGGSAACGDYTIEEEVTTGLIWGDVNQDDSVNVNDSAKILSWLIGGSAVCGDYTIEETATVTINN